MAADENESSNEKVTREKRKKIYTLEVTVIVRSPADVDCSIFN